MTPVGDTGVVGGGLGGGDGNRNVDSCGSPAPRSSAKAAVAEIELIVFTVTFAAAKEMMLVFAV